MTDLAHTTTAVRPALDHVMDARLHNLDQEVLLFDPSPDVDSALEHAAALLHCPDHDRPLHVSALLNLLRRSFESNRAEGGHELEAAGILDPLVKSMHQGGRRAGLTAKEGAARLREPLRLLDSHPDGVAWFVQCSKVKDVLAVMDPDVVRGTGMRAALGINRHKLLLTLTAPPEPNTRSVAA